MAERTPARGADAVVDVDRPHDRLAADLAAEGPYDLVVDYLWGAPTEAVFDALARRGRAGGGPERVRHLQVGMSAGDRAALPAAMTLRAAPVELIGSGHGGPAELEPAGAAFADLLEQVAAGGIALDVRAVPLADVEKAWTADDRGRRVVFVP